MGNLNCSGTGDQQDPENNNAPDNPQLGHYTVLLGPMFGGSFPASVGIYNLIKTSADVVKLFVFGGVTLVVFSVASGLAATSLGRTAGTVCYARFATLTAITTVLSLFTAGLCALFSSLLYQLGCAFVCGVLILVWIGAWFFLEW